MRRLLLIMAFVAWALPASAQNCVTINGITRCAMPSQIYDTAVRATSVPVLDLRQIWNNLTTTFTGFRLNVTDTNSATASLLMDLQVAGTSKFSVTKAGAVTMAGTFTPTGVVSLADGSVSAPSATFASATNAGIYNVGGGGIGFSVSGTYDGNIGREGQGIWSLPSNGQVGWTSTTTFGTPDTTISRAGVAIAKVAGVAATPAELQVSGGNGGFISPVKALTELTTIAAAATTSTAIQIPVNAVVLGVSVRVVTIIPTAATFTVTSATPTKTWNTAAVTVAAGSTDPGTLPGPTFQTTASAIVITPNLTPGAATGQVRVTIFYYTITPPTS